MYKKLTGDIKDDLERSQFGRFGHFGAFIMLDLSTPPSSTTTNEQLPSHGAMRSALEQLPTELQRMIFSRLDYESLIHLSTTNRLYHQTIDPRTMADPMDKLQFVMRAAKDFPQHRPSEKGQDYHPGNFECYICFRVRSPDCFDVLQAQFAYVDRLGRVIRDREPSLLDSVVSLRRFCIECGVHAGLHVPSDCLTTKTGRDLWVCRCWRVWPKPGVLRCPDCAGDCPLRPRRKLGVDKFAPPTSIVCPARRLTSV